ncbi:hypothetical protein BRADI_4g26571v3 [Brachypodium distachyon]|uniref:RING-type domain-containing protein n=1 Tax=Brachypodium distachyon TaxID=15368 RepID=A0A0Q3IU71_BRADI|nr:hypothetical protein BRADI_4g26571v3 [Brachypodium distachyon]
MAADEVLSPSQALRLIRLYMSDLARESGNGAGGGDGHEAAIQPDDGGDGQFTILHIHGSTTGTGDDDGVGVGGEYNDGTFMMTVHTVHIHSHAGAGEEEGLGVGSEEGAYRDGGFGAVPASRAAIDGLPEAAANDAAVREASCAVCLESLVPSSDGGGRIKKMPCCSNGFHERCIADWLRVSRLCPCCRFALPAAAEEDNDDGDMEEGES